MRLFSSTTHAVLDGPLGRKQKKQNKHSERLDAYCVINYVYHVTGSNRDSVCGRLNGYIPNAFLNIFERSRLGPYRNIKSVLLCAFL